MMRCRFAYLLLTVVLGLMQFGAVDARGEVAEARGLNAPAVDSELAVRVAEAEAKVKWPGSRFLSVVPYHDPSGNVTAWAVQLQVRDFRRCERNAFLPRIFTNEHESIQRLFSHRWGTDLHR